MPAKFVLFGIRAHRRLDLLQLCKFIGVWVDEAPIVPDDILFCSFRHNKVSPRSVEEK
jgi:hypothetical protein